MLLASVTVAPIEGDDDDEVAVEVLYGKPSVEVRRPAALYLNAAGEVLLGVRRYQVVAGKVRVRFERLDTLDEQVAKY